MGEIIGEVTSVGRTGYFVRTTQDIFCIINNSFKGDEKPIVGDKVIVEAREDKFFITGVKPRRSVIVRNKSAEMLDERKGTYVQYFAANVDIFFIITSANREFSINRIKRFMALTEGQPVKIIAVVTKIDVAQSLDIYTKKLESEGIAWIGINAKDSTSVKQLLQHWKMGETALLVGTSGVGKSTLINTLCGLNLKTSEIMDERRMNRGRHTTSARTMYYLPCGRKIIDMPGVKFVNN